MSTGAIRVLVVDDSALVRKLLTAVFEQDPAITVVGSATDPYDAREKIKALSPDVLTLDVEMPKMDGLTFLRNLMRLRPMPVVMVSSLTERNAEVTISALELGAIDFVSKPKVGLTDGLNAMASELCEKVKIAARARVRAHRAQAPDQPPGAAVKVKAGPGLRTTDRLIAIGASTGGTEAIAEILEVLPPDSPAVVITQHIPEVFSTRFAARLDGSSALRVSEAKDGEQILLGHAYVAPGNHHLRVTRSGAKYFCKVTQDDPISRHRPSVDALFCSVAESAGANATGVLLTGMGADGADGLLRMRDAGSHTIAQDRESCVVFGMPGEAIKRNAAVEVLPLDRIAQRALAVAQK